MAESHETSASGAPGREFDMESLVGSVLLVGVLTSMALIAAGELWSWTATGQLGLGYSIAGMNLFEFMVSTLRQAFARALQPRLLVDLGIAALMLTPYVRVLASVLFFAFVARNWKYTLFTGFVFVVLTYSLFLR